MRRGAQRHKRSSDTRENSLHIPLDNGGQLPRERRAVGAAETAVGRFMRAPHPENPDKQGILDFDTVEFS